MTIDEILAAMPEPAAEGDHDYLVIDPANRTISVPDTEKVFGVTGDELADRKYFLCPRIVGDGLDLSGMFIRVNYRNANGEEDGYLVNDVAVTADGDYVTFSWQLTAKVAAYMGAIQFGVCADLPNTSDRKMPDWNTTMAAGEVLEGLHPELGDVEGETSDVVTQLRAETAAQTAAVAACGAEQIQAVKKAAATETAAAEAQVAAKGAETLATIPADYSTLAGKVNEQANAIKGQLSGAVIRADDVSPVEHFPTVRVRSKNHFIVSKIVTTSKFTKNNDGTITVLAGQYSCPTGLQLKQLCPSLEVGKTAVLSIDTDGLDFIYSNGVIRHGVPFVVTEKILDGYVAIYGAEETGNDFNTDHTIRRIQIEEGKTVTPYTPYIAPETVTLTRCGKNLIKYPFINTTKTMNGITFTDNGDGTITVTGTATEGAYFVLIDGDYGEVMNAVGCESATNGVYTVSKGLYYNAAGKRLSLNIDAGTTVNETYYPQLELGDAATAYEPYTGATAMPAADGTVTGLPSAAPTMTLLADTAGVTIDCTYNRDTNAVYAEILAKIAALSG